MKFSRLLMAAVLLLAVSGCSALRKVQEITPTVNLALIENAYADKYTQMNYGIRLNVSDGRADTRILQKYDASATRMPAVNVSPDVLSFVSESMRRYMRTMGFNLDADIATDYMMSVTIKDPE